MNREKLFNTIFIWTTVIQSFAKADIKDTEGTNPLKN